MASASLIRPLSRVVALGALLLSLLVALHLISSAVQNSEALAGVFVPLLVFSLAGLVVLLVLVLVYLARLVGAHRRGEPGARLTARMAVLFVVLSLFPVAVVYGYSMQFLMRGIDSWFDVEIEKAMEDALALGQASLDLHKRNLLRTTETCSASWRDCPSRVSPWRSGSSGARPAPANWR